MAAMLDLHFTNLEGAGISETIKLANSILREVNLPTNTPEEVSAGELINVKSALRIIKNYRLSSEEHFVPSTFYNQLEEVMSELV